MTAPSSGPSAPTPIYVTQPDLPPLSALMPHLEAIWARKLLTNGGPCHQQLEAELAAYLGVPYLSLFNNGTIALMTAVKVLGLQGEVITTPFSFVATAHALAWQQVRPVFVDIDPVSYNLDPRQIEAAITPATTGIVAVHCYGNPCAVAEIQAIANRHQLKVLYDAAHAFGVRDAGGSILRHGDLAVLSFHATKVFSTLEGGAIVCRDAETKRRIDVLKNFGIISETEVVDIGLNGKMNEVQAAFGLASLAGLASAFEKRGAVAERYRHRLAGITGIHLPPTFPGITGNHSYFPILVDNRFPMSRDDLYRHLKEQGIHSRRYFFPLISDFPPYSDCPRGPLTSAHEIAGRVLCLPIYPNLSHADADRVIAAIFSP